ncbi:hypothetical protein ON010_g14709 [Phytophthora cinnamomi]|nr:hypothetical protein ON010_g14709 [Phytophthora cinnamomi]
MPEQQRQAAQEFMERELADTNRRVSTPSRPSKNDIVKLETSTYSGVGDNRLPLNRWFREIDIAITSRIIMVPKAKVSFLLSRLFGKAKEWALGKLVVDPLPFPTLEALHSDLRLAFEPPQDGLRIRAEFFALKQGKMSMGDYVKKTRHLESCIITHPIDTALQVRVFVFGMREGTTRYFLIRAEHFSPEEALALALREDYVVAASYARAMPDASRVSAPEPMETDAIQASGDRRRKSHSGGSGRNSRPLTCFRCQKIGRRPAECRAPAPVLAHVDADATPVAQSKNGRGHLHVVGTWRPLRAPLDSGATSNSSQASCLSALPQRVRIRTGPGEVEVKLADWLARSVKRRRGFDVREVLTHLSVAPRDWPHVTVVDKNITTRVVHRASDGPLCMAGAVLLDVDEKFPRVNARSAEFPQDEKAVDAWVPAELQVGGGACVPVARDDVE